MDRAGVQMGAGIVRLILNSLPDMREQFSISFGRQVLVVIREFFNAHKVADHFWIDNQRPDADIFLNVDSESIQIHHERGIALAKIQLADNHHNDLIVVVAGLHRM